jgi:two-component system cell cycle sensor histidine kinase/response regulator CckA
VSIHAESRSVRNCRLFSHAASAATVVAGSLALLGWLPGIPLLTSILPGLASMKPNTALCFVLAGVSLWLIQVGPGELVSPRVRRIQVARLLSGGVALIGLLTLVEYLFHLNLDVDAGVSYRGLLASEVLHPTRMAGTTALGFMFLGSSGLLMTFRRPYPAHSLALLASLNGFIPCVGYLLGVRSLYATAAYASMARHNAILFIVMGLALLAARPRLGLMAAVTSEHMGGVTARRVLLLVVGLPIFLGWLRWRGEVAGLYGPQFGIALLVIGEVVTFATLVWMAAVWLNHADQERRRAQGRTAHLAAIVESSSDAIFSKDMLGTIISWNQGAERLYGYSAAEIVGKSIVVIIPEELHGEAAQFLGEIAAGRVVTREETLRRRRDGTQLYVSLIISPVRDSEGRIVGASTIAHDITERKRAEDALRDSELRYRRLFETAKDGILILDAHSGRIVDVNPFLTNLLDYPREDFLGRTLWDLGSFRQVQQSKAAFEELQGQQYIRYEDLPLETRTGGRVNVEFVSNVYGINGKSVIQCNIRDITERKLAEEKLRKSEERFSKAFCNSPLASTISTETDGRYLDVNDAYLEMVGRKREDVIGRTTAELNFWAQPSKRSEMIQQLREGGRVTELRTQYKTSTGETREADVSSELIELEGQACVLAITRDVTETLRLEAQFRQAQKMEAVGRLAGGVAHDFNNMLGVIIGYSDLSLGMIAPGSPVNRHLEQIKKASHRAVGITRQLLAFSRQQVVFPKNLDLNEVVQNVITMLQRLVGEDVAMSFRPTVPIGSINADPGQIEQILMNLVVNARDAMPGGGEIVVETGHAELDEHYVSRHAGTHAGQHVVLVVSDTGCGMEESIKSQIFEPFFTTKGIGQGTGLGLSTVYGIVKQGGGTIYVYSEPGKGTTFKIYFPSVAAKAEQLIPSREETAFPGGSETILVVEDDEPLRELTVRMLQDAGYRVTEAKNAESALDIVKAARPGIDLVLTDVVMPGKSGVELLEQAKAVNPSVHSLFMSGYTGDLMALRGGVVPEAAFLEKPFTRNSLLKKVRSALHSELAKQQAS